MREGREKRVALGIPAPSWLTLGASRVEASESGGAFPERARGKQMEQRSAILLDGIRCKRYIYYIEYMYVLLLVTSRQLRNRNLCFRHMVYIIISSPIPIASTPNLLDNLVTSWRRG